MNRPKVFVRFRPPLNPSEGEDAIFSEIDELSRDIKYVRCSAKIVRDPNITPPPTTSRFDKIFQEFSPQENLFSHMQTDICRSLLNGHSIGLLMYGPTGSGKTYTMQGPEEENHDPASFGLLQRTAKYAIEQIDLNAQSFEMKLSCVQIYNSKVEDMLSEKSDVNPNSTALSQQSKVVRPPNVEEFMRIYNSASSRRRVARNNTHNSSSRSHAITYLSFTWLPKNSTVRMVSSITFVDLAGSEGQIYTQSTDREEQVRVQMRNSEGEHIRTSLSNLTNMLKDIAQSTKNGGKRLVSSRGSSLTQILDHILSGESLLRVVLCMCNRKQYGLQNSGTISVGQSILKHETNPKMNKTVENMDLLNTIRAQQSQIDDLKSKLEHANDKSIEESQKATEVEVLKQASHAEEIRDLHNKLSSLRAELASKSEHIQDLNNMNLELEYDKQKLEDYCQDSSLANRDRIMELENKIKEKEEQITQVSRLNETFNEKLQSAVNEQAIRDGLLQMIKELSEGRKSVESDGRLVKARKDLVSKEEELDSLNIQINEILKTKERAEKGIVTLKSRIDDKIDAEQSLADAYVRLNRLEENMSVLTNQLSSMSSTKILTPEHNMLQNYKSELDEKIRVAVYDVNKYKEKLSGAQMALELALSMVPMEKRDAVLHSMSEYVKIENKNANLSLKAQEADLIQELKDLEEWDELDDEAQINPLEGLDIEKELFLLKSIQLNDELTTLIQSLPYNVQKIATLLTCGSSYRERFFELEGLQAVVKFLPLVRHSITFASLCYLLDVSLYHNDEIDRCIETSNVIPTIEEFVGRPDWKKHSDYIHIRILDLVSSLATRPILERYFRNGSNSLRAAIKLIEESKVQSVLTAACKSLARISPSAEDVKALCQTGKLERLCCCLVTHFGNPSAHCRLEAAMAVSKLLPKDDFKRTFFNPETLRLVEPLSPENVSLFDHTLNALNREKNTVEKAAFAVLLLSMIEASAGSVTLSNKEAVMRCAYEALASGFAIRLAHKNEESFRVTCPTGELPYFAEVTRGYWTSSASSYTHGGNPMHGLFFDNPMYRLHVSAEAGRGLCDQSYVYVAFAMKKMGSRFPTDDDSDTDLEKNQRQSYFNISVVAKSDIILDSSRNCKNEENLRALLSEEMEIAKCPFSVCVKPAAKFHMSRDSDNVGTFQLKRGETYFIVPYIDVRCSEEQFVLSVVSSCDISMLEMQPSLRKDTFNGIFPLPPQSSQTHSGFEVPAWRSYPQLLVEPNIKKPAILFAVVSYLDIDNAYDELYKHHDELLSDHDISSRYQERPYVNMKLFDNSNMTKRHVTMTGNTWESSTRWQSSSSAILTALIEPEKSYSLSIVLNGKQVEPQQLPFRLQMFCTEYDVKCSPLVNSNEWFPFTSCYSVQTAEMIIRLEPPPNVDVTSISRASPPPQSLNGNSFILYLRWNSETNPCDLMILYGSKEVSYKSYESKTYVYSDQSYCETYVFIHNWLNEVEFPISLKLRMRNQAPSDTAMADRILLVHGFACMPLTISPPALSMDSVRTICGNLSSNISDRTIKFFEGGWSTFSTPFHSLQDLSAEPIQSVKTYGRRRAGKKVLVDVSFLEGLYSKINTFINAANSLPNTKWISETNSLPNTKWISETINALSRVINVAKYAQMIERVSPKTIRNIFIDISLTTGCGVGLFSPNESDRCCKEGTKEDRRHYLTKLVLFVEVVSEERFSPSIDISDIIAGKNCHAYASKLLIKLSSIAREPQYRNRWNIGVESANFSPGAVGTEAVQNLSSGAK